MNVNFRQLLMILLPISLRVSGWIKTILNAVATQFNVVKDSFDVILSVINYDIRITPQICYLEKVLNDHFQTSPHIKIIDGSIFLTMYFTESWQSEMEYFDDDNFMGDSFVGNDDFVVMVPAGLTQDDHNYITAVVNKYKLPSKTFIISIIQ
jgi:hypothetical protein